jgi:hypothetical protein
VGLKKIRTEDETLNRVQDNIDQAIKDIERKDALARVVIEDVELLASSTDNFLSHKLDRKIKGFLVVRKNANADIWESATENVRPEKQIILRASAAVTATIWVF